MKRLSLTLISWLFIAVATFAVNGEPFWLGADISGTTELEARGVQLMNAKGEPRECTALMNELGLNAVRLRVWVNPKRQFSNKEDVLVMAKRAKALGMEIMIDFHYSDWWADPGKQNIPDAWKNMDYKHMKRALAKHTTETLKLLKKNKIDVKWVQVGNETTNGFLWPMGQADINMSQYAGFTQAGYEAVKKVYPKAIVIVHLDAGSDAKRYNFIFDGLKRYGAHWDMIGMSLYPYWDKDAGLETTWQGSVDHCVDNIIALHRKYGSRIMIVETGVDSRTPVESKPIMAAIIDAAKNRTQGICEGVFYWAPEADATDHYPLGAFDHHRPTIIMDAFTEAKEP